MRGKRLGSWSAAAGLVMLAAALFGSAAAPAGAGPTPTFHDVHLEFAVPRGDAWYIVSIQLFVAGGEDGDPDAEAAAARSEILARFPGAVPLADGDVHAQWVAAGWRWPDGTASWRYNATGKPAGLSADEAAITGGATAWNSIGVNFSFSYLGTSGSGTGACHNAPDGTNTVGWGPQAGSVLAVTCTWYDPHTNPYTAVEFDMEFDPDWPWTTGSPVSVDLQSVAAHELGHALGLGHSEYPSAVMYATYSQGQVKRTPTSDDIAGAAAIYGWSSGTPTPTPSATPTPTPTPTPVPPPIPLQPGLNLAAWPGPDAPPAEALAPYLPAIAAVYGWDAARQQWLRYAPELPPWANTLALLRAGDAYWFIARSAVTISPP